MRLTNALHEARRPRAAGGVLILRDPRYVALWEERAIRTRHGLDRLGELVHTTRERAHLAEASVAFDAYRTGAAAEHAPAEGS